VKSNTIAVFDQQPAQVEDHVDQPGKPDIDKEMAEHRDQLRRNEKVERQLRRLEKVKRLDQEIQRLDQEVLDARSRVELVQKERDLAADDADQGRRDLLAF
jgi:hypothetical protein